MPKLERVCFLFLVEMQVINLVQPWPRMGYKQFAHNILDRQRAEPSTAGSADIMNDKVLEWQPLGFEFGANRRTPSQAALLG